MKGSRRILTLLAVLVIGCSGIEQASCARPTHRSPEAILQTTLADGGIYNSEPAGSQCDPDGSYFVMASGRRVATLERPGCTGGTLVITREMLTGPEVVVTPAPGSPAAVDHRPIVRATTARAP